MKRWFCLFLLLASCGTDSGNPGASAPVSSPAPADFIGFKICAKLAACYGASECTGAIYSASNFTSALGLVESTYPTLSQAISGIGTGALILDPSKRVACHAAIDALTCGSPQVQNAYSTTAPQDFNQAYRILSADVSCSQMIHP